jgi:predicted acetyltransferase
MARRRVTARQADERARGLWRSRVAPRSDPEDLDRPLDGGISLNTEGRYTRIALTVDESEVSSCGIVDFQQQIGSQTIHMGGVAGVGTHREHRFQGYSSRVLENALRWMRANEYDASMLYGIAGFYPRFGYAPAFPTVKFSLAVRDAEAVAPGGHRLVRYRGEHLRAVLRMYQANNAMRTGVTSRLPGTWEPWRKGLQFGTKADPWLVLDDRGRPVGYVVYHKEPETAKILEVGFRTAAVFPSVVRHAARRAVRERMESIELFLPEDDLFVDYCKGLRLKMEREFPRCGGAMVRLVRVPTALGKVAAELGSRMTGSGHLNVRTNLDDVGLAWSGSALRVGDPIRRAPTARMPQWALAQLLYGYRRAAGLEAAGAVKAPRKAIEALEEMFPVRPHYHYAADHF